MAIQFLQCLCIDYNSEFFLEICFLVFQDKIILIFFIIGTIIISGLGIFYKNIYEEQLSQTNETQKVEEYNEKINQIKKVTIGSLAGFGAISILSGIFISHWRYNRFRNIYSR